MKLTQVLMRKRKMIKKPQSFVDNMLWNNSWYRGQERPVRSTGMKERLADLNKPVYQIDELISPIIPLSERETFTLDTRKLEQKRDESHPLWKEEVAYTYNDSSWQAKDNELIFAQANTNTVTAQTLPENIVNKYNNTKVTEDTEWRLERLLVSCYVGDAWQVKLPRNFKVPYIGWHPVESRMKPRNLYDHEAFSWGWKLPREYGIPNWRKLGNLTRGLFREICKNKQISLAEHRLLEESTVRQFVRRPDGKLVRINVKPGFFVTGSKPLKENTQPSTGVNPIQDVSPLDPVTGLYQEHIYDLVNHHPIKSMQNSHPYIHTVVRLNKDHINPMFREDKEKARSLMYGYAVALGQARLLYGSDVSGDLKNPVTVNSITTDGRRYVLSSFQLNSMDLSSAKPNLFSYHHQPLDLFEFCGYKNAKVSLEGVNLDTFRWLEAVMV